MNVEAQTWYGITLNVRFDESQEIDTSDPAWLGKLLSGRLATGAVWVEDIDWRLASADEVTRLQGHPAGRTIGKDQDD